MLTTRQLWMTAGFLMISTGSFADDRADAFRSLKVTSSQSAPHAYSKLKNFKQASTLLNEDARSIQTPGRIPHNATYLVESAETLRTRPKIQEGIWYVFPATNDYPLAHSHLRKPAFCTSRFQIARREQPSALLCEKGISEAVTITYRIGQPEDRVSTDGLFGVTTYFKGKDVEAFHGGSDNDGVAEICLPYGRYQVDAQKAGYRPSRFELNVEPNSSRQATVVLCAE